MYLQKFVMKDMLISMKDYSLMKIMIAFDI